MLQLLGLDQYSPDILAMIVLGVAIAGLVIGYITDLVMSDRGFGPYGNRLPGDFGRRSPESTHATPSSAGCAGRRSSSSAVSPSPRPLSCCCSSASPSTGCKTEATAELAAEAIRRRMFVLGRICA